MKGNKRTPSPIEFYEQEVAPAVFERLDSVFPEFGFRRKGRGWVATDYDATKARFGVRSDRLFCNEPIGVTLHGEYRGVGYPELLMGFKPTGLDFVEAVKDLARAAGVDTSPLERELTSEQAAAIEARQRRADILETFATLCRAALLKSEAAAPARAYLTNNRGFREDELEGLPLGFYPGVGSIRASLQKEGFSAEDLDASGVLADGRWSGRLVIPWRDQWGRISTAAARDLQGSEPKYLYLKNGAKPAAFGLDVARRSEAARREGLVVVEGLLDVVLLQARGVDNVAALGGAGDLLNAERWAALSGMGFPSVSLALDADAPGRESERRALENLRNVRNPCKVYVLSHVALKGAKDPDELVRVHGLDAFREALRSARPWALHAGESVLEGVTPASADRDRREAVERVLDLSADLSGRLAALDREDLVRLASERTGYSPEALQGMSRERHERRERERRGEEAKAAGRELAEALGKPGANVYETISRFSGRLAGLGRPAEEEPPPFSVDALLEELRSLPAGIRSGWEAVDDLGVRFNPGELSLLAARTGHGKTSALVNLLWRWLKERTAGPLVFYSFEEPAHMVLCRLAALASTAELAPQARWPVAEIRDHLRSPLSRGPEYQWPGRSEDLEESLGRLRACESKFRIVHCPEWGAGRLAAHARELADQHGGLGAVFVDYLQRIPAEAKADRRDIEVSAIGRTLKSLAVDASVPVIAGAQINREAIPAKYHETIRGKEVEEAKRYMRGARPELHHLREGGSEQEADMVLGLMNYAADLRAEAEEGDRRNTNLYEVGVLKNRYGGQGRWAALTFEGEFGLLRDREAKDEEAYL